MPLYFKSALSLGSLTDRFIKTSRYQIVFDKTITKRYTTIHGLNVQEFTCMLNNPTIEKIIALCKRRGFVYQSAEIYGGINGVYDFGHLGTLLKMALRSAWIRSLATISPNILLFEGSILGPEHVWNASGHLQNFHDPMVDCQECKHRYRADEIDLNKACSHCGKKAWTEVKTFNMMFKTEVGAAQQHAQPGYLRPETAQSIFINFKNAYATNRVKLPFGIAQIGKAFRNEINPKHFLFRMREFEQMELEWFCHENDTQHYFELICQKRLDFHKNIGLNPQKLRLRNYEHNELAHYSTATSDIEYEFPFGWKEIEGIANRGSFDLSQHTAASGKELTVFEDEARAAFIPHVVESSVGVDRLFLTLMFNAYHEESIDNETRIVLQFSPKIAPIKAAFLPLTKNQADAMHKIYITCMQDSAMIYEFDESGSIGKRYRRQDEIGTPLCFTYDFDSANDNMVTVRHRDSMKQERIAIPMINTYIYDFIKQS